MLMSRSKPRTPPSPLAVSLLCALAALPLAAQAQTAAVSTVVAFSGSNPVGNLVKGTDGALYGTTSTLTTAAGGLIYRSTIDGSSVTTLHQFTLSEGYGPQAGLLIGSDNKFYGTTTLGAQAAANTTGTVFSMAQDGSGFTIIHRFPDSTGRNPQSAPINTQGASVEAELIEGSDTLLYGVARSGGPAGNGTIFRLTRDGTAFTVLRSFGAITSGATVVPAVNADGIGPAGPLVQGADGYLYGTTSAGGANGRGTVFRIRMDGTGFQLLHVFSATTADSTTNLLKNSDGASPLAGLLDGNDGFFYGVTPSGGTSGNGVVFAISPDGATYTVLHHFDANNGAKPNAELALGADGKLYGSTSSGGTNSSGNASSLGTLFSIARDGTGFTKLHSFDGTAGTSPASRLLQLSSTVWVGVNASGGKCGQGSIFSFSTTGATVDGNTRCGRKKGSNPYGGGGGATGPTVLILLGAYGIARRRRNARRAA